MTKPKVILFNGICLDGRMDNGAGGVDMGLYYQIAANWNADAMLSGSSTILAAFAGQDQVTNQSQHEPKVLYPNAVPYLVVVDSRGQIQNWKQIQSQPYWQQTVALCSQSTPQVALGEMAAAGVPVITAGTDRLDLHTALEELNTRFGIQTLRVDSGGVLNGILLRAGLVDEVSVLISPALAGASMPGSFFDDPSAGETQPIPLRLLHCEQIGTDVLWLRYEVKPQ